MTLVFLMSLFIAGIILFLSTLSQVALWQQKEYRWDRLKSHLKSPPGSLTNYPLVLLAMAAILIGWLSYIFSLDVTEGVGWAALVFFFLHHFGRISHRGILRPDFTVKAITIIILALLLSLITHYSLLTTHELLTLQFATFIFFLPGFVALSVLIANFLFNIRKKQIIKQAKRLRSSLPNLTVVGITGSYGKTSTKHFLEQILKNVGQNVVATKAHHNTPIGIAQDMLALLPSKPDIFIAELSAYRKGEIKELNEIVRPNIGVITAIGNQHIDLFGSPENILKAKWELIESLPQGGLAILNADDVRLKQKKYQNVVWYSTKRQADVWVEHLSIQPHHLTFTVHLKDFTQSLTLPLASEALLRSALAAATVCLALEIPAQEIINGLKKLKPFPRTMEIRAGKNGATIIDDSHSANEHGTLLALQHLGRFPQPDKRVIFLPFIELGAEKSVAEQHVQAAVKAARAKLFTYEKQDPKTFAQEISQDISDQTVILLEGRVPDVVRKAVLL